ncbi:membrane protein [Caldovatus sediminis]|jgi:membrane protein implicated in regulation of membrane protease activity|uniref:Membrane protein n=1 Tax=Caldovatus sediminis TaxID=2041189 RepID=A0A8J3EBR4_9PROT|nr:NfeD family protein [Caldovatus sediminis]GGG29271.1 membrane protein [Caldovatus sediminis]
MGDWLSLNPGLAWILVGLLLLGAEILAPGVYLLWIGLAAIGTGLYLMVAPAAGLADAVVVFLVLLAASIAVALRLRGGRLPRPRVNTPDSGLVGRTALVVSAAGPELRVRVGDSEWLALPAGGAALREGEVVRVVGVRGTALVVDTLAHAAAESLPAAAAPESGA